jgi:hypothetical protein
MRDYNNHNTELMVLPFVWHVSYVANDFHIALQGILPGKKDHVFANNHFHSLKKMWPIPMVLFILGGAYSRVAFDTR